MEKHHTNRVVALVAEGLSPAQIAKQLVIPTSEVLQHLSTAVNAGRLSRSDVFFTLNKKLRETIEMCGESLKKLPSDTLIYLFKTAFDQDVDPEEVNLYFDYCDTRFRMGDMYELLTGLENILHGLIKSVLVRKYGKEESGWWRKGVPETVRISCAESRERDHDWYEHPFGYTTLIHLSNILEKRWGLFQTRLPSELAREKSALMENLRRLNTIRNRVMHPVRGGSPSQDDFEFVKSMRQEFDVARWRLT